MSVLVKGALLFEFYITALDSWKLPLELPVADFERLS